MTSRTVHGVIRQSLQLDRNYIQKLLTHVFELEHVPIILFDSENYAVESIWGSGMEHAPWLGNPTYLQQILAEEQHELYLAEGGLPSIYYGILHFENHISLLMGPICPEPLTARDRRRLQKKYHLENMELHVRMASKVKCRQILEFLFYLLTGENLDPEHISPKTTSKENQQSYISQDQILSYRYRKLDQTPHHSYAFENQAMEVIGSGDEEASLKLLDSMDLDSLGQMAFTPQKTAEYLAVLLVSMVARTAIRKGVSPSDAYALNDLYLQKVSLCTETGGYHAITKEAVRNFCRYIRAARNTPDASLLMVKCKNYITRHLNKDLSLETLSRHLQVNPAYLSHAFSVQEGMTLNQFIVGERIRAAKNMLQFSDYSVAQISSYLGFSTQSYFGSVFRQKTGYTPVEFRKQHQQKDSW